MGLHKYISGREHIDSNWDDMQELFIQNCDQDFSIAKRRQPCLFGKGMYTITNDFLNWMPKVRYHIIIIMYIYTMIKYLTNWHI